MHLAPREDFGWLMSVDEERLKGAAHSVGAPPTVTKHPADRSACIVVHRHNFEASRALCARSEARLLVLWKLFGWNRRPHAEAYARAGNVAVFVPDPTSELGQQTAAVLFGPEKLLLQDAAGSLRSRRVGRPAAEGLFAVMLRPQELERARRRCRETEDFFPRNRRTGIRLGIAGVTGREPAPGGTMYDRRLFDCVVTRVAGAIERLRPEVVVVGGAPWVEHAVVWLFSHGSPKWDIKLHLAADWDWERMRYSDSGAEGLAVNPGGALNGYFDAFYRQAALVTHPAEDLGLLLHLAATGEPQISVEYHDHFADSRTGMARECTHLLALSWDAGEEPVRPGGARHLWQKTAGAQRVHAPLLELLGVDVAEMPP